MLIQKLLLNHTQIVDAGRHKKIVPREITSLRSKPGMLRLATHIGFFLPLEAVQPSQVCHSQFSGEFIVVFNFRLKKAMIAGFRVYEIRTLHLPT